jgi:cbb3-type cytochrome oxidase subunit 3
MITIVCGVLLLAVFAYVFWPERASARQPEKTRLEYLGERKQVIYENLRDLNFEYRAGKYPEEDYAAQRAALENEAAEVVAEMELLEVHAR